MAAPLPTALNAAQPDPDLWFDDGNVIVIAQQTAFRFHRGALSRQSEIFRGMFTLPQPTSSTTFRTMDGCPVIAVTDTSDDFGQLLRAVYDGASVFSAGPMEFGVLASIVRMGHKYGVSAVLEEALRRLNAVFTSDLSAWDTHVEGSNTSPVMLRPEDAVEAVNIFVLIERTDMLATAYYMCGLVEIDTLLNGVTRDDGTVERLSIRDLQRCLTGRAELVKQGAKLVAEVFHLAAAEGCRCPSEEARNYVQRSNYARIVCDFSDLLDPLPLHRTFGSDLIDEVDLHTELCTACVGLMRAHHSSFRRDLWGRLPGFFRLLG